MFTLTIQRTFSAAHALMLRGRREPIHGHDWLTTVTLQGPTLDQDGLLVDFHHVEAALDAILSPMHNANLNDHPAFADVNPSAELVAKHIADALTPDCPQLVSVSVTEAPGCAATYSVPC